MGLLLIIFIVLSAVMTIVSIVFISKNTIKNNAIKEIYKYNRIGFKRGQTLGVEHFIEYEELERFKNGFSRVKLKTYNIMTSSDSTFERVQIEIKSHFKELEKTDSIEWLECDEDLMEVRRKKLERLIK